MAILRAAATADDTLDQSSDTLVNSLTLTPANGDYFLFATITFKTDDPNPADFTFFNVYVGGSKIDHTERVYHGDTSVDNAWFTYAINAKVSPTGSQAVEIRYRTEVSSVFLTAKNRELTLFPMPSSGTNYEQSATANNTMASSTFETVNSMSVTPVADDYLLVFSTSTEGPSGATATYRVSVGGTVITQTNRLNEQESSAANDEMPIMIACKISPNGSQVVEVEWARTGGSGTIETKQRAMSLIPMDAGDIFEAKGTGDDTDSTTTNKLLDDMTITDPGAADYLVMFSTTDFIGSIGNGQADFQYSMREGGSVVAGSERICSHEGSIDSTDLTALCGGRVTVGGGTDDIEIFWQGTSTNTRTSKERILIAIREAAGGTEFTQTVLGGLTPTGAPIFQTQKAVAGSATPTGAIVLQINKAVIGTITPTGVLNKDTSVSVAGAATPTGAVNKATQVSVAGAATPTGAVVRQAQKVVAGALTPTGAIVLSTLKALVGAVTPTGLISRLTSTGRVAGALTPTGALTASHLFSQALAGAVTATGAVIRQARKVVLGALTPTGAVGPKDTSHVVAGTITPTGAVNKLTSTARVSGAVTPTSVLTSSTVFTQSVAGAESPAGAIVKQPQKVVAGTVGMAGIGPKATSKGVAGTITPTGALQTFIAIKQTVAGAVSSIVGALGTVFQESSITIHIAKGRASWVRLWRGLD